MSIHDRFNHGFHMTSTQKDRIFTLIKIASGKNLTGFRYIESDDEITTEPRSILEAQKNNIKPSDSTELQQISNLEHKKTPTTDVDQSSATITRKFHTLEEFEELMEKLNLFETRIIENAYTKDEFESLPREITCNTSNLTNDEIPIAADSKNLDESAGWKRKAMGRQLESLKLPIAAKAEFLKVGSLKEWMNAGEDIYSPETYVTPKFGSYEIERREFGVFSPELVAVFEECMRRMDAEEVDIVKQIEERFESESDTAQLEIEAT